MSEPPRARPRPDAFREFCSPFLGSTVTHPWFSDESVLFLEIGSIVGHLPSGRPSCERHIFLGHAWTGSWPDGASFDRHTPGIHRALLRRLPQLEVRGLDVVNAGELNVRLSGGLKLTSLRYLGTDPEPDDEPDWWL